MRFNLGDKVRDTCTRFTGTVVGIATYLGGFSRALIAPASFFEPGKTPEEVWIDTPRLELVK